MEQVVAILIATVVVLFWITPGVLLANLTFKRNTYRWDDNRLLPIALYFTLVLCWPVALLFQPLLRFWRSRQHSDNDEEARYRSAYKRVMSRVRGTISRGRVPRVVPPADIESQDRAGPGFQTGHASNDAVQNWNPRATTTITGKSQNTDPFFYTKDGDLQGRTVDIIMVPLPIYAAVVPDQVLPACTPPPPTSPVTPVSARCNA